MKNIEANTVELMIANRFANHMLDLANEIRAEADRWSGLDRESFNRIAGVIERHDFFGHAHRQIKSRPEND